jgi:hypothetical protein
MMAIFTARHLRQEIDEAQFLYSLFLDAFGVFRKPCGLSVA